MAVQDTLASLVKAARWLLTYQPDPPDTELGRLRGEVIDGSSYAAFRLAVRLDPPSFERMLHVAGVYDLTGDRRQRAFDACADGFAVYDDGVERGNL